jgi:two-component system LytT family sensor kinase
LHGPITVAAHVNGDLIGYVTAFLITVVLLVLTLRAAKLPGTPLANIVFAVCAMLWAGGGLARTAFLASRIPHLIHLAQVAEAVQFIGAAPFPIPILIIWQRFAVRSWQKTGARILTICAYLSVALVVMLFERSGVKHLAAYDAALLVIAGAAVLLRRDSTPRSVYLPSLAIVSALSAALIVTTIARFLPRDAQLADWLGFAGAHLVMLVVVCTFLLFARFRYADVFIRYAVRILLAGAWAGVIAFAAQSPFVFDLVRRTSSPEMMHVLLMFLVSTGLVLSFTFVDDRISALICRWLFRAPDYRAAAKQFGENLRDLHGEPEIAAALEEAARGPLELNAARVVAIDSLPAASWPAGAAEGEIVEIDNRAGLRERLPIANVEILVPIASQGRVTHVLLVSPGAERPGLVTRDLNYLRTIATQCGNRLDALRREEEAVDRQSREALLLQQVTEAELRALRAQINPHFLFNCLNTIADLVVRDPARAETMTVRLAEVFRHVLDHSSRPLTSIRDEIEFLRTYLYIEEARFGDRLQVQIDVAPEIEGEQIPSLILQPLVENALKHGLGPKPGPGHLRIAVRALGDRLELKVEDDGMGPSGRPSKGLGLANIAERLRTLYQDRASVSLEPRAAGGSVATVLIPRGEASSSV